MSSLPLSGHVFSIMSLSLGQTQHSVWVYIWSASVCLCLQHHVWLFWPSTTLSMGLHLVCLCLVITSTALHFIFTSLATHKTHWLSVGLCLVCLCLFMSSASRLCHSGHTQHSVWVYVWSTYLSTHTVYQYKIIKNHYLGGNDLKGKLIQENIIFMRFCCCCFKLSKKIKKTVEQATNTRHRQLHRLA